MLASTLLRAALTTDKPSIAVFDTDVLPLRAWPWTCDLNGHVNNARYFDIATGARMHWLARVGVLRKVIARRYNFILAGADILYRRSIPRMAPFEVRTRVVDHDARWIYYEHLFVLSAEPGTPIAARMLVRGQLRNRHGGVNPVEGLRGLDLELPATAPEAPPDLETWKAALQASLDLVNRS